MGPMLLPIQNAELAEKPMTGVLNSAYGVDTLQKQLTISCVSQALTECNFPTPNIHMKLVDKKAYLCVLSFAEFRN